MTGPTPHVGRLVTLAALFGGVGVLAGRIELAVVAAAFAARLAAGVVRAAPLVDVRVTLSADRCVEGEEVQVVVTLLADADVDVADVVVELPAGLGVAGERRVSVTLRAHAGLDVVLSVRPLRWGVYRIGPVSVAGYGRTRLAGVVATAPEAVLRVLPAYEPFRTSGTNPFLRALAGAHVSRAAGEGVEPAGIRPYVPGDALRRVNWRQTARRGDLYVTEHRPERNAETVLFLDTFLDPGPPGATSLDVAVRASAAVAEHLLASMDRVGLVGFGGVMRWLTAATGRLQRYRAIEHLLGTEVVLSYAWKDLSVLPSGCLPPRALVLAFSPLLDERAVGALADLARRGFGVVVVDTAPEPVLPPPRSEEGAVAQRIWYLEREELVRRLGELGVPVVRWTGPGCLDLVLVEVARLHSRPRLVTR